MIAMIECRRLTEAPSFLINFYLTGCCQNVVSCHKSEQLYISEKKVHQIAVEESVVVVVVMRYIHANDDLPEKISRQLH